jgi:hypothetical protein
MTLHEARCTFSLALAELIVWSYTQAGYELAVDQVTVPAIGSVHMPGSLHESGLAADLLLYLNGVYQSTTDAYSALGIKWVQMGIEKNLPLTWGGNFTHKDGNHFSLSWMGKS